jgi:prevent-host-death family protein
MATYSLSEARANLPLILTRVERGEEITITRRGHAAAVIVGHDRWVKTARLDVLEQARQLHAEMAVARSQPFPTVPGDSTYDAEGHIAWLRENDDPWDEVDPGTRQ